MPTSTPETTSPADPLPSPAEPVPRLAGLARAIRVAARTPRFHVGVCGTLVCLFVLHRVLAAQAEPVEVITAASCAADAWDACLAVADAL